MFGRRRHAAAPAGPTIAPVVSAVAPHPRLAEEQIFELVHARIAAAIGEGGEWVVRRRTPEDTDELFRAVLAHQVAVDVTAALRSAQLQLEAGEPITVSSLSGSTPPEVTPPLDADQTSSDETLASLDELRELEPQDSGIDGQESVKDAAEIAAAPDADAAMDGDDRPPAHRHDEPQGDDDAVLDEEAIALQWEPAPITVWTDLKKPVTGPIAMQLEKRDLVA